MTYGQDVSVDIVANRSFLQSIELLIEFVKKDLKTRYRNIVIGIAWTVIQPLLMAYIFTHIRNYISPSHTVFKMDYSHMYIILISWLFFASAFQRSINSIYSSRDLIFQIKFPIFLLPLSVVISSFIDVIINVAFYIFFFFLFKGSYLFNIPVYILVLFVGGIFIMALCLLFSILNCFISEIRYVIPYITNLSLFAFPILYNENFIQDEYKTIYMTIPVVWIIAKSNDILVGNLKDIFSEQTFIVFFISFLIFSAAYLVYWKVEKYITDYL